MLPRIDGLDRNLFINGGMDYFERGLIRTDVLPSNYKADRFYLYSDTGAVGEIKRTEDAPSEVSLLRYCAEFNLTTTPQDANDRSHRIIQRIESVFTRKIAGSIGSFSFWVKTADFSEVEIELSTPTGGQDNWSGKSVIDSRNITIVDDGTWKEVKVENVSVPVNAKDGLQLIVWSKFPASLGATNFKITGFKMNVGTKAQGFSLAGRDLVEELDLCQRYYEKSYDSDTTPGTSTTRGIFTYSHDENSQTHATGIKCFNSIKRVIPTISFWDEVGNVSKFTRINSVSSTSLTVTHNVTSPSWTFNSWTNTRQIGIRVGDASVNAGYQFHWEADAEL